MHSLRRNVLRVLFGALAGLLLAAPARAADPVFPTNSRIGLVAPAGFTPSNRFPGFENPQASAAILLVELPGDAYADVEKGFTDEALKARGMTVQLREPLAFKDGKGFFISGPQESGGVKRHEAVMIANMGGITSIVSVQMVEATHATLTDAMVRDTFKTLAIRPQVPESEKLAVLPYKIGNLAKFRIVRSGREGVAILTDGPSDEVTAVEQPFMLIGVAPGEAPKAEDRDKFARGLFGSIWVDAFANYDQTYGFYDFGISGGISADVEIAGIDFGGGSLSFGATLSTRGGSDGSAPIDIAYAANATDVQSQVLQLKEKKPDVVIMITYTSDAILFAKTMQALDYKPPMLLADDAGYSDPSFIKAVGKLSVGAFNRSSWSVGPPGSPTAVIAEMYKKKSGDEMDDTAARQMQGFLVLAEAIDRAGSTDPAKIQAALKATDLKPDQLMIGYKGVKFDEKGQNVLAAGVIIQLQDGENYVAVWPKTNAQKTPIMPYKGW